jgi:hypothetical protein
LVLQVSAEIYLIAFVGLFEPEMNELVKARVVIRSAVATDHLSVLQNGKSMVFMACLTSAIQKSGFNLSFQRGRARRTRPSLS